MARLTPDPTFYASPSDAASAPVETHAYVVTLNTGTNGDSAPDALTVLDLEAGLVHLRPARRPARHAQRRRRAAPLRLERLLVGAVPVGRAPARRAPLPARARACAPRASTSSTSRTTRTARSSSRSIERRGDRRARPATRGRTRSTAGPTASTSPRWATRRATGPGGIFLLDHDDFSVKGAWEARPRAAGAGLRLLVAPQPRHGDHLASGARRTWSRTACKPELLLGNQYGHKLHVWDLREAHAPSRRSTSAPSTRWCSSCARRTTRARPTGSSASSSRPPT